MTHKPDFEMAHADDPEGIIKATQRSMATAMIGVVKSLRDDPTVKMPGMTWDVLIEFIQKFSEKEATVIMQNDEM